MLKDIDTITNLVFKEFIPTNIKVNSAKAIYDVYRSMDMMISNINIVKVHYLALDFTEDYLQNSSYGEPSDKWRRFFNEDLEQLNKSVRNYLNKLYYIAKKDDIPTSTGYLSKLYNVKRLYSFVNDEYNIGFVEPCGFNMISTTLKIKDFDEESYYISEFKKTDLSTYEKRLKLQELLNKREKNLKVNYKKLNNYISLNYKLEDLL